ncbi:tetratricopeptide repeat protein [Candidatus Bipolaricaulota bacterium]
MARSWYFHSYRIIDHTAYQALVGIEAYRPSIDREVGMRLVRQIQHLLSPIEGQDTSELEEPRPVLLVGKTGAGKTQMALDVCAHMGCGLLQPRIDRIGELATSGWLRYGNKSRSVFLLDDLSNLIESPNERTHLTQIIHEIICDGGHVLATCREESYAQLTAAQLDETVFRVVTLPEWSEEDAERLAEDSGEAFDRAGFDGTPLSITMGFRRQREVYAGISPSAQCVVHAMKLLYVVGLLSKQRQPARELVREIATSILTVQGYPGALQQALNSKLLYDRANSLFAYEAIMERVVIEFPSDAGQKSELSYALIELLRRRSDVTSMRVMAVHAFHCKEFELSIDCQNALLALNPKDATSYSNRGVAWERLGHYEKEIEDCTRAIELNPNLHTGFLNRGIARINLRDDALGMEDLNQAILLNPTSVKAYVTRAEARRRLDDAAGAIKDCDTAINIEPGNAVAYCNRGAAKGQSGDRLGAIQDSTHAIELDSEYASPYDNRAVARALDGDISGALEDWTEAIRIDPRYAPAYWNRGAARRLQGDAEGYRSDRAKAIELDPQLPVTMRVRVNDS